ncbi:hypothetical protein K7432_004903 [Basidiobolus ranarum]|uniref:Uncharacterized protein n=1 Tax=Basidiobolus ranarum TaxID=34480 RepID=A0ABR2WXJ8_9FUNG
MKNPLTGSNPKEAPNMQTPNSYPERKGHMPEYYANPKGQPGGLSQNRQKKVETSPGVLREKSSPKEQSCCGSSTNVAISIGTLEQKMNRMYEMLHEQHKQGSKFQNEVNLYIQHEKTELTGVQKRLTVELSKAQNETARLLSQLVTANGQLQTVTLENLVPRFKKFENKIKSVVFSSLTAQKTQPTNVLHQVMYLSKLLEEIFGMTFRTMFEHITHTLLCLGHEEADDSDFYQRNLMYVKSIIIANFENSSLQSDMHKRICTAVLSNIQTEQLFDGVQAHLEGLIDTILLLSLVEPKVEYDFTQQQTNASFLLKGVIVPAVEVPFPVLPAIYQIDSHGARQPTKMQLVCIS